MIDAHVLFNVVIGLAATAAFAIVGAIVAVLWNKIEQLARKRKANH